MSNDQIPNLDSWEDFSGKWLKAEMVKEWPALFIPVSVRGNFDADDEAHIVFTGAFQGKNKDWEPNNTNKDILKTLGLVSPRALIGKKVYFKKVMNFNPTIKKKVPSLEIEKIE
jgi:hypothetical protein